MAACAAAQKQDLRDVERVMKRERSSLVHFDLITRSEIDPQHAVVLVRATPGSNTTVVFGLYAVEGPENRVKLALDILPGVDSLPTLELATPTAAYVHYYSDYGMYAGSVKYFYDLVVCKPPIKMPYHMVGLTTMTPFNESLLYNAAGAGSGTVASDLLITLNRHTPGTYKIDPAPPRATLPPVDPKVYRIGGQKITVDNVMHPGQLRHPSVIRVGAQSYPVPEPTKEFFHKMRRGKPAPRSIEIDIGPSTTEDARVWFANSFYDGEGVSGVGAIGSFDVATRKYEMRYLPEIAPWSGSAILLDGDDLWIGLMGRPEGADYGGGLLRFNTKSGDVTKYAVKDYIHTLDAVDGAIYCGTSNGLYMVKGDKLTQLRFEPNAHGKLVQVTLDVR